ncbi:hypothetical protein [Nostoc sp.]
MSLVHDVQGNMPTEPILIPEARKKFLIDEFKSVYSHDIVSLFQIFEYFHGKEAFHKPELYVDFLLKVAGD